MLNRTELVAPGEQSAVCRGSVESGDRPNCMVARPCTEGDVHTAAEAGANGRSRLQQPSKGMKFIRSHLSKQRWAG